MVYTRKNHDHHEQSIYSTASTRSSSLDQAFLSQPNHHSAGKLFGIQANTPASKVKSTVNSTSWDLLLLRIPEFMFNTTKEPFVIPYVITKEKSLSKFANATWYREINLTGQIGYPADEINLELFPKKFSAEFIQNFENRPSNSAVFIDDSNLQRILGQMELRISSNFS